MGLNVALLESSFAAIAPQADALANTFYRNLFADYPEVKPLFANVEMKEQKAKLIASLSLVVANLRKPDALTSALTAMGARHVDYGAEAAHYPAVGATLLKSLAQVAGGLWTNELNTAWAEAYDAISEIMLQGAPAAA